MSRVQKARLSIHHLQHVMADAVRLGEVDAMLGSTNTDMA
jgi:hypothetical protein